MSKRRWRAVRALPDDDPRCGWTALLPSRPPARRLEREESADCVVVGAGFTGLAIARRLAELRPEWRVIVLEAQRVGDGASGRNSGFVVDLTDAATALDPAGRERYVRVARAGIQDLRDLVRSRGIGHAWDESGWIRAAAGETGRQALDALQPYLEEQGIAHERLDASALEAVTGSSFYRWGLRFPDYSVVQPVALARGLADHLPASVVLYEETPVTHIARGRPFRLRAGEGSVKAERLFLATNGYSPALGFLGRRVFPVHTFASFTRVLTRDQQERLGGEPSWAVLGMDPMSSTVRRTRDQRLFLRNTVHYAPDLQVSDTATERARANHRKALLARFPGLADVELELTWSGLLGTTYNHQVSFGELEPGLFAAAGYTGAGIAMGTAAGRLLAELAAGHDSDLLRDLRALPSPTLMPPEPLRGLGGRWILRRMSAKAGEYL